MPITVQNIAPLIDHTLLRAEATGAEIDALIEEARRFRFASACVNPVYIRRVALGLEGSGVKACAVIGFPLGANSAAVKAMEAADAVEQGAEEIDVVAYLPNLLAVDIEAARIELAAVVTLARQATAGVVVKVIVESALLLQGVSDAEGERRIAAACRAVRDAGADYIKTSSGSHPAGGASERAVTLMKRHAGGLKVKASGGIRTFADAVKMIQAGADRLGCSTSVAIRAGAIASTGY